jgi:hypothetical protein
VTDRLQHATDLSVSALRQGDPVPRVGAFTSTIFDGAELGHAITELHAIQQALLLFIAQSPQHAHSVLALQTETRVHQLISQFTRAGKQQKALGVQVQTSHGLPLALVHPGQLAKHRRAALRIVMGNDFTRRLVVRNDARRWRVDANTNGLAVDLDAIAVLNPLADVCRLVVD